MDTANNRVGVNQATPLASFQYERWYGYVTGTSGTGSDAAAFTSSAKPNSGVKLLVSIENSTDNAYETHEAVITHDGSTGASAAMITTYGTVKSASQTVCTLAAQEASATYN